MKREFAISTDREAVQDFLARVKVAETRGFNLKTFTEAELRSFETTGKVTESSSLHVLSTDQRKKLLTWTPEDARRSAERHKKLAEEEVEKKARENRLDSLRKEIISNQKIVAAQICVVSKTEEKTTLFI